MRLIDADKLYWKLKEKMEDEWNQRVAPASWADAYEAFMDEIYDQPTIDAEPVVRCENCKHYYLDDVSGCYECAEPHGMRDTYIGGFCSCGERRGDG